MIQKPAGMKITTLPFNQFIGLTETNRSHYLLMLPNNPEYTNHLGTVHASALFALAEATSGYFLLSAFPNADKNLIPVVRAASIKYKSACKTAVYSSAKIKNTDLNALEKLLFQQKRATVTISVECFEENGNLVLKSEFDWFIGQIADS